jgi:hypothetical protein
MASKRRRPRWRSKRCRLDEPGADWTQPTFEDVWLVRRAIREDWPVPPKRGVAIMRQLLSHAKSDLVAIAAARTYGLAEKANMAKEAKAGKILKKLERDALNGLVSDETLRFAKNACRAIVRHSKTEWLVRRATSVLGILRLLKMCQITDPVERADQTQGVPAAVNDNG